MTGLILFAHGARDPRWADPLWKLRDRVRARAPAAPVEVAFLDFIQPDLPAAAERLVAAGCTRIDVVPVFLGQGGHVRRDLAALVATVADRHPQVAVRCAPAVGEDDGVLDALAACAVAALGGSAGATGAPEGTAQ